MRLFQAVTQLFPFMIVYYDKVSWVIIDMLCRFTFNSICSDSAQSDL